jgi:Protein of unknown function (DUF3225)
MEINNPQVHTELTTQFNRYQKALIDNDVAVLNELFWNNVLTIRYGVGENLYGHAAIATYRTTRDPQDLPLVVGTSVVTTYGREAATTNIEFTRAGRKGRQSQTWIRLPEGWRIVAAHVSLMPDAG